MKTLIAAAALALTLGGCAMQTAAVETPAAAASATALYGDYETDRKAILAMAGDFRVMFDFKEIAAFVPGYELLKPKDSGGFEIVRVIADTGEYIALQHILVMEMDNGQTFIIKHWRQDWTYQPKTVLTYAGAGKWVLTPVASARGAWSQTVWQTDDSPRYGGVGRWRYDGGDVRWTSDETFRPLARRDAVRNPVYDRYRGVNRHALTPKGWVHEQDNAKMGLREGKLTTIVHETVINTYRRDTDFPLAKGDAYWAKTKDYWAAVRGFWDAAIAAGNGVSVTEEAENGSVTGPTLMGLADEIVTGAKTTESAVAEARAAIATATGAALK
ncbi:MAG: hypothetical protein QM698_16935 [Micropepsaceae bacterium]